MQKNLFQQTVFEVYKNKENVGYKVIETEAMFVVLWSNPQISGLNVAHCNKFDKEELDFLQNNFKNIQINIACDKKSTVSSSHLKPNGKACSMILETSNPLELKNKYEVKLVQNKQDIDTFCQIAGDAFQMQKDISNLAHSLYNEKATPLCQKYIGYIENNPAGIIEIAQGHQADLISWVGIAPQYQKLGLSRTLMAHVINQKINKGRTKFTLSSGETSQKIYAKYGFAILNNRYNYILEL